MNKEVMNKIKEKINEFNQKYHTAFDSDALIDSYFVPLEFLQDNEEDKKRFKEVYSENYKRFLAEGYKKLIARSAYLGVRKNQGQLRFAYLTESETLEAITEYIKNFDYMMARLTKYTLSNSGIEDNIKPEPKDFVLGGLGAEEINTALKDSIPTESPMQYFERTNPGLTENQKSEKGMLYIRVLRDLIPMRNAHMSILNPTDMEKSETNTLGLFAGEYEKQAAAIYLSMRKAHRSHNIFWRIFLGGESRERLENYKEALCEATGWNYDTATDHMKQIARDNDAKAMETITSRHFMENMEKEQLTEGMERIKEDEADSKRYNAITEELDYKNEETELVQDDSYIEMDNLEFNNEELQAEKEVVKDLPGFGNIDAVEKKDDEIDDDITDLNKENEKPNVVIDLEEDQKENSVSDFKGEEYSVVDEGIDLDK